MLIDQPLLDRHANNLTLVRLGMACMIIWSHCYWQVVGVTGKDGLSEWLGTPISDYGIDGFFFISGFLVLGSVERSGGAGAFLRGRAGRMGPALAVALAFGFGLWSWARHIGWSGSYFDMVYPLWPLLWLIGFYGVIAVLAAAGLTGEHAMKRRVIPLSLAFAIILHLPYVAYVIKRILGISVLDALGMIDRLWTMFALGIAAYLWRARIELRWGICLLLLIFSLECQYWDVHFHVTSVFVGYTVLCCGFLSAHRGAISGRWPNFSYELALCFPPILIIVSQNWNFSSPASLALANLALTIPFAVLLKRLVEKLRILGNLSPLV